LINGDSKEFKDLPLTETENLNTSNVNERIAQRRAKGS